MDVNELTIAAAILWLLTIALAGALVDWNWTLMAVGVGVLVGVEAAVASERTRLRIRPPRRPHQERALKARCPMCGLALLDPERRAICPRCLADLKVNCPSCGAVVEAKASRCPACRHALLPKLRSSSPG